MCYSRVLTCYSCVLKYHDFLVGNRGPEAFYDAQEVVYHQLEEKHYPQFIVSQIYHNFIINWDGSESMASGETGSSGSMDGGNSFYMEIISLVLYYYSYKLCNLLLPLYGESTIKSFL